MRFVHLAPVLAYTDTIPSPAYTCYSLTLNHKCAYPAWSIPQIIQQRGSRLNLSRRFTSKPFPHLQVGQIHVVTIPTQLSPAFPAPLRVAFFDGAVFNTQLVVVPDVLTPTMSSSVSLCRRL